MHSLTCPFCQSCFRVPGGTAGNNRRFRCPHCQKILNTQDFPQLCGVVSSRRPDPAATQPVVKEDQLEIVEDRTLDDDGLGHAEMIQALGKLRDPRAAGPPARRLSNFGDRSHAGKALRELGPVAEPEVLKCLQHRDAGVRTEACKILKYSAAKYHRPARSGQGSQSVFSRRSPGSIGRDHPAALTLGSRRAA